jgi:mono/diheme cytochrome c family protein
MAGRNSQNSEWTSRSDDSAGVGGGSKRGIDIYKVRAVGLVSLFVLTLPATILMMQFMKPEAPTSPWASYAAEYGVEPVDLAVGETFFKQTCAVCHGQDGQGILKLGKPLRNSEYVQSHTDAELFDLISQGRAATDPENTTGAIMPARANNPLLNDERLQYVVLYLKTMQDPDAPFVVLDDWIVERPAEDEMQIGGVGHDTFIAACSACHGPSGQGMDGLGKPLRDSPFVNSKTDEELMLFIKSGRPIWDAENTTGVDMPPKGGNPALKDEEILTIIKYLRVLHEASVKD